MCFKYTPSILKHLQAFEIFIFDEIKSLIFFCFIEVFALGKYIISGITMLAVIPVLCVYMVGVENDSKHQLHYRFMILS